MKGAEYWIETLRLESHPEGGFFRETYRSEVELGECCAAEATEGSRPAATVIYYLLRGRDVSTLHRLRSDEVWHHYDGGQLAIHMFGGKGGGYERMLLGKGNAEGERPQGLVRAGTWFGAAVSDPSSYCLVGCTVAPGFDFRDLEMARREEMLRRYPDRREVIVRLTPNAE